MYGRISSTLAGILVKVVIVTVAAAVFRLLDAVLLSIMLNMLNSSLVYMAQCSVPALIDMD